jgi:hypothetical protein
LQSLGSLPLDLRPLGFERLAVVVERGKLLVDVGVELVAAL